MHLISRLRLPFLIGILALGLPARPVTSQDASSQVRMEIARLERAVSGQPDADPHWKDAKTGLLGSLSQARESLDAGRLYLSLEEMEGARTSFRALETTSQGSRASKNGVPGFEIAWRKARLELSAFDGKAPTRPGAKVQAAVRALAETAEGQATILLAASRAYARVTNAGAGFYYLGEAKAAAESVAFCSSLPPSREAAPPLRSVAPELRQLQEQTTAAFTPPRSIQLHGDFIRLNATLKLAGELDSARLHAGSLYQYLDAVEQLGRLDPTAPDAASRSALRGEVATLKTRLRGSRQDDSIALLFLQRAEARLAGRKGAAPSEDDWKTAAVLVDRVLPAYFALQKPAAFENQRASQPVTVTLVRWPYT
jgi:hypothetical protein